jgi:ribonuclease HI
MKIVTDSDIEAAKTKNGGWTRKQLAEWGVSWPPRRGWKRALIARSAMKSEQKPKPVIATPVNFRPDFESDVIYVFTDGSCLKNPGGPGGWAYVMWLGEDKHEQFGHDQKTTNNRMEVIAAIMALEDIPSPRAVHVYSDSQYLIQGASKWISGWKIRGWKTKGGSDVLNKDLWLRLDAQIKKHSVTWFWVRGHNGHRENERCDHLAGVAAAKQISSGGKS